MFVSSFDSRRTMGVLGAFDLALVNLHDYAERNLTNTPFDFILHVGEENVLSSAMPFDD